jgi:hypothetical protein
MAANRARTSAVLAIAVLLAMALAVAAPLRAGAPDRDALVLSLLLDLNPGLLFDGGKSTPLQEREAIEMLYVGLREAAEGDTEVPYPHIRRFALLGWIANERNDSALTEAFISDFKALYDRRPDQVLAALADVPFLGPEMCATLARYYFFEDAVPQDRFAFIEANEARIRKALGMGGAARCVSAFLAAD